MASGIQIRQMTKRFGDLVAVNAVDLDIDDGEVLCLLGPSGCGKTTTLRMVAGLEDVSEGEICIDGNRVNDISTPERNVAMAFQFYALYPSITVAENLSYPLHAEQISRAEIKARIASVADKLDLTEVLNRYPSQLAEGEKQRVAVGRAIIRKPSCFLFDEPLSRLDIELRQQMRTKVKEVLAGLSKPTVIVTHDQIEALTMADRIAVMRDGKIEQVATPHDIFAAPSNTFVAGFIGTPGMNLIPSVIEGVSERGELKLNIDGQHVVVDVNAGAMNLPVGAKVTLGVRPRFFETVAESSETTLSGKVDIIEPMGAETLFHVLDGTRELRVVMDRTVRFKEGETIHLEFQPKLTHVFDAQGSLVQ
ncbi:MAG: ABC transporter ATP-binding protein [Rhodospirillales bacterium]|nr:ABC transporter ATP-binding protein [Rhodospirillales bacterium]